MANRKKLISNLIRNIILIPFFTIFHVFYELYIGLYLFRLAGGITYNPEAKGFKTFYGGIDWAFETLLYTPGSYWLTMTNVGGCVWEGGILGFLIILLATILTAVATGQFIQKIINKECNKFGKYNWRLIVVILGWVFIPVPVEMTMAYQFTVLC